MDDLISRRDVVDAIGRCVVNVYLGDIECHYADEEDLIEAIKNIPSASMRFSGYDIMNLKIFANACKSAGVEDKDLKGFVNDCEFARKIMLKEMERFVKETIEYTGEE